MNKELFDKIIEERVTKIKQILASKGEEYATQDDRFYNFHAAAKKANITPERALKGMMLKHEVSVDMLIDMAEDHPEKLTIGLIDEKIGDTINYLILLEGLLKKRILEKE